MAAPDEASATIVWFRNDLRLADHPALRHAVERGGPVVPVFIWAPDEEAPWAPGAARRWWLHHSLDALGESLEAIGSTLILRTGPTREALDDLITKTGAGAVVWSRRYEPAVIERDKQLKRWLTAERDAGCVEAASFNAALLYEPWEVETKSGGPYKVFTPFWRMAKSQSLPTMVLDAPESLVAPEHWPQSKSLDALGLLPERDWADGFADHWTPGEAGAHARLERFLDESARTYKDQRDFPSVQATSGLSPHLLHGEIGPRQVLREVERFRTDGRRNLGDSDQRNVEHFVTEIGWREFAYHVLYHFPGTPTEPLQEKYAAFPWNEPETDDALHRWQTGRTGYPIVDAGMRQLWTRGWMHNRVRMVVASFLVKHLLISWEEGARWFWDTLVDADLASNTLGWQWAGGCGADAAPYFRIFNPITQGEKFDGDGAYVHTYVPELAGIDGKHLHDVWDAPLMCLESAGVELTDDAALVAYAGDTTPGRYPCPVVEHKAARERALEALDAVKS